MRQPGVTSHSEHYRYRFARELSSEKQTDFEESLRGVYCKAAPRTPTLHGQRLKKIDVQTDPNYRKMRPEVASKHLPFHSLVASTIASGWPALAPTSTLISRSGFTISSSSNPGTLRQSLFLALASTFLTSHRRKTQTDSKLRSTSCVRYCLVRGGDWETGRGGRREHGQGEVWWSRSFRLFHDVRQM